MQGAFYQLIGALEPAAGMPARFLQAYIYDPDSEMSSRLQRNPDLEREKLALLYDMLRRVNPNVDVFSRAADRMAADEDGALSIVLTARRNRGDEQDPRRYNLPTADEVAMIIPGEVGQVGERDIVVRRRDSGHLQRMDALAPAYDPLQYPLLFPKGEDGWTTGITQQGSSRRVTMRQFYAYRLQV